MTEHCRVWGETMLPASYKGVPFFVDQDEIRGGRRISVHEFTNRDEPFNEDLGGHAKPITVNAYLSGDDAPNKASALFAICNTRGAGSLVLPNGGVHSVQCLDVVLKNDYRQLGIVKVSMTFIKDAGLTGGLLARVNPVRQVQVLAAQARQVVSDAFSDRYQAMDRILGRPTDLAMAAVASEIKTVAGLSLVALEGVITSQETFAKANREALDLADHAEMYSRQIAKFSDLRRVSSDKDTQPIYSSAGLATNALMSKLNDTVVDRRGLFLSVGDTLLGIGSPLDLADDLDAVSVTKRTQAKLLTDYRTVARQAFAITAMQAAGEAAQDIKSRRDARFIRARMGDITDQVIAEAQGQPELDILTELRGEASRALREAPILEPTAYQNGRGYNEQNIGNASEIVIEANKQLPAHYWAWYLYGDPDRAEELIVRNDVPHPSFMPYEFEAQAK